MVRVPFSRGILSEHLRIDYDDGGPSAGPEGASVSSQPMAGRGDIDAAVLEELRRATVRSCGLPDPIPADSVADERADIDAAMLEALRSAAASDAGLHHD